MVAQVVADAFGYGLDIDTGECGGGSGAKALVAIERMKPARRERESACAGGERAGPPPFTGEVLAQRAEGATASTETKPPFKIRTRIVMTRVAFKVLTTREIADYAASGEGEGKAGGYAIQGRAEAFVRFINGSYSNVVGLPLYETVAMLENWRIANSE